MEGASTEPLRSAAAKWSLAGDEHLLQLLQKTHERIVSKCQDVNGKLDEMASALSNASIDLQNVNNKFMALSNSQFVESRVYDDDDVLATEAPPAEVPPAAAVDEVSMLRASLAVLAGAHDTAEILDDSDSDSDAGVSVVLKPKDVYSHRPLPHIIGSQHWRNKWHAGLIVEDSDTDSTASDRDREAQFSDTESEELARPERDDNTLSESGSSLGGSLGVPASVRGAPPAPGAPLAAAEPPPRPADIAAALARRLAVHDVPVVQKEPQDPVPQAAPIVRKLIKPEAPATSNIFPDEPPPLDVEDTQSSDDDIFAEINKHAPYTQKNPVRSDVTEDLFSFNKPPVEEGDIFSDFAPDKMVSKPAKQKSALFEDDSEPELFVEPPPLPRSEVTNNGITRDEPTTKKPVGGISLFGSNQGTESIGAAILTRNQRKSTSDEDSGSDNISKPIVQNKTKVETRNTEKVNNKSIGNNSDETNNTPVSKKEKDIFDDLFSKPTNLQKKDIKESLKNTVVPDKSTVKEQRKTNVKDLFSDNIFDDIDDIFTSNVKVPTKTTDKSNQKSLFDDDDLFSDIETSKPSKTIETNVKHNTTQEKKSIFDSDDDLFSDVKTEKLAESFKNKVTENVPHNKTETIYQTNISKAPNEINDEKNVFNDFPETKKVTMNPDIKSKSIFDSDSDADDIFAKVQKPDSKTQNKFDNTPKPESKNDNENLPITNKNLLATAPKEKALIQSPSLFEEDEIDDLFIAANKFKSQKGDKQNVNITYDTNVAAVNKISSVLNTMPEQEKPENENTSKDISESITREAATTKTDTVDVQNSLLETSNILTNKPSDTYVENEEVIESSQDDTIGFGPKDSTQFTSRTKQLGTHFENSNVKQDKNVPESPETQQILESHTVSLNKSPVTPELKDPIPQSEVFDDIFSEPPAFEKTAEPKKSKNVNALFDDDSDDESLFFKKDDVISDEKPEIFSNNVNFDIFVNEPPAIDIDFTTKSSNNSDENESKKETFTVTNTDMEENTYNSETNETIKHHVSQLSENSSDIVNELFSTITNKDLPNLKDSSISHNEVSNAKEDLFVDIPIVETKVPDQKNHEVNTDDNKSKKIFEPKQPLSLFDDTNGEDLFTTGTDKRLEENFVPKNEQYSPNITKPEASDSDEELFASLPKSSGKDKIDSNSNTANKGIIDNSRNIIKPIESPKKDSDVKKIGKLNTKNFNINVNALIPGASPKKVPKENKEDLKSMDEPQTVKILPSEIDVRPKPVNKLESDVTDQGSVNTDSEKEKSVTFDEKSESGVLDNNASKQRARIQVKRRPSSRRARHEAARRSAIDFGDDTDNSSSFDEPKPKTVSKSSSHLPNQRTNTKNNTETDKEQIVSKTSTNLPDTKTDFVASDKNVEYIKATDLSEDVTNELKPTTTKVVYILNDEDIFNTNTRTQDKDLFQSKDKVDKSNILSTDDVDNSFKTKPGINTLGNVYKDTKDSAEVKKEKISSRNSKESLESLEKVSKPAEKGKLSLFDDSDEELFGKKKEVKNKTTIFDSDSEEDLFSGKKSKEKNNKEQKNKEVKEKKQVIKSSLFSDDDDDDLFGLKKDNKSETKQKPIPSTSKEVSAVTTASKAAEPVFSDPLSLLGNDD